MRGRRRRSWSSSSYGSKKLKCCMVYKRRRKNEEHETGISDLPEHILHHIFSFLDIKQAIQTCILSTRWRYFWVSIPTLIFNYTRGNGYLETRKKGDFVDFVNRVLMFRGNLNIQGVVLDSEECINVTDHLNTWILASVLRNVQQLTLDTLFPEKFHFHHSLFTCKSLTKLVVRAKYTHVSLSLPDSVTLPRLKTFSLDLVNFKDECVMDQIFSSCPVLESLIMKNCEFRHQNINISSPQLQHLVLKNCETRTDYWDFNPVDFKFKLCAPNLISFHWDNYMSKQYAPCMVNIPRELHNVEDLTLSASFLEVITRASDLLDSQLMKFCNLRYLKLTGTWRSVDCIHAISYLLKNSPIIETLFVEGLEAGLGMAIGPNSISHFSVYKFVYHGAPDLLKVQPAQFCNLRCLKMNTLLSRDCIYAIAYLLKISPQIETLSFKVLFSIREMLPYWDPDEVTSNSAERGDYWKAVLSLECLLNHVKCVELHNVMGLINELEFIEFLLMNAMLLEKLLVFTTIYSVDAETERRRIKFSEKVLTFPRSSSSVVIMFK